MLDDAIMTIYVESLSSIAIPTNFLVFDENKTIKFTVDDIMMIILHKDRIHLIYTYALSIPFSLIFFSNLQMSSNTYKKNFFNLQIFFLQPTE